MVNLESFLRTGTNHPDSAIRTLVSLSRACTEWQSQPKSQEMNQMSALYSIETINQAATQDATPLQLVKVFGEFHREKISYCYWKSSRRLHGVLAGEGDVDLLIASDDQHRALAILLKHDFKLFPSMSDCDHPGMLSLIGYDELGGQLIHIHLHFRLIIGERLLANYYVPWEKVILARAILHPTLQIKILDPTSEAVLLVVRACLELGRFDPITRRSWNATTHKIALDRTELAARVDRTEFCKLAAELLSDDLAGPVADAFYGEHPLERQGQLRRRIRKYCAAFRSYNAVEARMRSAARAVLWVSGNVNKHLLHAPRPWSRRAPGSGHIVAIIGVDGSGKSTLVATMRAWLGSKLDVVPIYMGTGDGRPSLLLRPFKLALPLVMRVIKGKQRRVSHVRNAGEIPGPLFSVLLMVWAVAVALDKRKKLTAARRGANRGLVVLTDRYPQDQLVRFNDGPLLSRLTIVPNWLRQFERSVYACARRLPPDLVIKLVVAPETAARREPQMDPAEISERVAALQRLEFRGARVVSLDAERPLPEVIRAVKHEIWSLI
jgi:hypothetical protein